MALLTPFSVNPFCHVLSQFLKACHYTCKHVAHLIGDMFAGVMTGLEKLRQYMTKRIDIISLSIVEDTLIVIPSDTGLDSELDLLLDLIVFLLFSCLGLSVRSISECSSQRIVKGLN